jgi:hypothetical protein
MKLKTRSHTTKISSQSYTLYTREPFTPMSETYNDRVTETPRDK